MPAGGKFFQIHFQNPYPMNHYCLINQFVIAEIQLAYWQDQRRSLGTLIAPRTDWEVYKHKKIVASKYKEVIKHLDEIISTEKLYADLYESA
jgi:hypothetical protein